jgi:hypothetical protein
MVACDTPEGLLATVGPEVLELRVDHPDRAADALRQRGVTAPDVQIVGGTAVVSLQSVAPGEVTGWLAEAGIAVRSATTRASDLDDVYLRLTGGQIHGSAD